MQWSVFFIVQPSLLQLQLDPFMYLFLWIVKSSNTNKDKQYNPLVLILSHKCYLIFLFFILWNKQEEVINW